VVGGVEADGAAVVGGGDRFQSSQETAPETAAARGGGHVHALDIRDGTREIPDPADRRRLPLGRDEEELAGRRHQVGRGLFFGQGLLVDRDPEWDQDLVAHHGAVKGADAFVARGRRLEALVGQGASRRDRRQSSISYSSQVDFSLVIES